MRVRRWLAVLLCGFVPVAWSSDGPLDEVAAVRSFMLEVESRHGLDGAWLEEIFRDARRQQSILDAFARPAEAKPWHAYREIFVTPKRVRGGAAFAREHRAVLERVRARFGVPPEIVAAIIGVETFYGRYTGPVPRHRRPVDTRVLLAPPGRVLPPRARGVPPVPPGGEPGVPPT